MHLSIGNKHKLERMTDRRITFDILKYFGTENNNTAYIKTPIKKATVTEGYTPASRPLI